MRCFKVESEDRNFPTMIRDSFLVVAEDFAGAEALAKTKLETCHVINSIESLGKCFVERAND